MFSFFTCNDTNPFYHMFCLRQITLFGQCPKWWSCLCKQCNLSVPDSYWKNCEHYNSIQSIKISAFTALGISFNPLNAQLNPICCLLVLLRAHHFLRVSRIRVKSLTLRLLMAYIYVYIYIYIYIYIYGAPILDVSRSHTTTQHSR